MMIISQIIEFTVGPSSSFFLMTSTVCCFVVGLFPSLLPSHTSVLSIPSSLPSTIQSSIILYLQFGSHSCRLFSVADKRNSLGSDVLFLSKSHPLFDFIHELYRTETQEVTKLQSHESHIKSVCV